MMNFTIIINKIRKTRAGVEKEKVVDEISFRIVKMLVGLWAFVKSYSEVTRREPQETSF